MLFRCVSLESTKLVSITTCQLRKLDKVLINSWRETLCRRPTATSHFFAFCRISQSISYANSVSKTRREIGITNSELVRRIYCFRIRCQAWPINAFLENDAVLIDVILFNVVNHTKQFLSQNCSVFGISVDGSLLNHNHGQIAIVSQRGKLNNRINTTLQSVCALLATQIQSSFMT